MSVAVIADIVGSRRLRDREHAQRQLDDAIARVEIDLPLATAPLTPTVGDEQQGLYPSLPAALASVLLLRLSFPEGLCCRFGVGIGDVGTIAGASGDVPEGPGWWAAREAIDTIHDMQRRAAPTARTWIVAATEEDGGMAAADVAVANAYVLARDEIVGAMTERARRLTRGRCLGITQHELAVAEGISQSAVSQTLTAAGASAIVTGFQALVAVAR